MHPELTSLRSRSLILSYGSSNTKKKFPPPLPKIIDLTLRQTPGALCNRVVRCLVGLEIMGISREANELCVGMTGSFMDGPSSIAPLRGSSIFRGPLVGAWLRDAFSKTQFPTCTRLQLNSDGPLSSGWLSKAHSRVFI